MFVKACIYVHGREQKKVTFICNFSNDHYGSECDLEIHGCSNRLESDNWEYTNLKEKDTEEISPSSHIIWAELLVAKSEIKPS